MHAIEGFLRLFLTGSIIKSGVLLAFSLLSPKKKLASGLRQIFSFDTLMFGTATGGFLGVFRLLFCKLKAIRNKEDKWNSLIAGFMAAFMLIIDRSKPRRITLAIYGLARCLEAIIKIISSKQRTEEDEDDSDSIFKLLKRGFNSIMDFPIFLMCVLHIYVAITWYFDIVGFPVGLDKPIKAISGPKANDWRIIFEITRKT